MYLYVGILTAVLFFVITYFDDKRNHEQRKPASSFGMKGVFLLFSFIIAVVAVQFLGPALGGGKTDTLLSGGSDIIIENAHLKNVLQDVEVGLPKF